MESHRRLALLWIAVTGLTFIGSSFVTTEEQSPGRTLLAAQSCYTDSECSSVEFCIDNECTHKPLFPLTGRDFFGLLASGLAAALAAGGGVGGGGVFVPLFILVFQFTPHEAIPLSKAMIFGGALANFYLNSQKRHPEADRPLIDYDAALMLEPATLAGTIIGVFMNVVLPPWLVLLLLLILLTVTTRRTLNKGLKQWAEESTGKLAAKREKHAYAMEMEALERGNQDDNPELNAILAQDAKTSPRKFLIIAGVWLAIFVLSLIKGGKAPSIIGLEKCSSGYWMAVLAAFPITIGVTMYVGDELRALHRTREKAGFVFLENDIKWTDRNTQLIPALSGAAGIAAGCMGIGGGMVKGPLLLELGMGPAVTSATSAFMILFTSSLTSVQFLLLGMLPSDYAFVFFVVGFVCTLIGQLMINYFIKKYKKSSLIVLCIAFVIGFSTLLLGYTGSMNVMEDIRLGRNLHMRSVC